MRRFKEIFIFVAGAAPQIITETVYALSRGKPSIYPDEIYIITTSLGKRCIYDSLIKGGIFDLLIKEYNLPPVFIKKENFIIPQDAQGEELEDIHSKEDNEILGDVITSFIRDKAQDQSARLHCSLAGGRKTMSFYLGSALQLFGRPWDRLYHVLVSPEFESNPDFFYKPKKNKIIITKDKNGRERQLNTKDARIILAELPFIRLSQKLTLQGTNFRELVAEGQKEIDLAFVQPELRISLANRSVSIAGKTIGLQPMLLFIYTTFLHQKIKECVHPDRLYCCDCRDCFQELNTLFSLESLKKLAIYYTSLYKCAPLKTEEFLSKWKYGLPAENVRQYLSKIRSIIQKEIPDDSLWPLYVIRPIKIYAASRYGIRVEKTKIIFE
ncbi:MAG: CRISPR-associated ring nuclease Csm6 [Clostridiales bacterium]|nr:CRISPR-associated ring nuclease Csm6 [Clostridiales bacterium]